MHDVVPRLTVPAPSAVADLAMADGAVIRLRRHGNPAGPRIALSHGNGLAIDAYLPFWSLLLPGYDVVLFDQRNHGQNPLHGAEGHDWDRITRDNVEIFDGIARAFGAKPVIGAFHSLSAVAAAMAALRFGPRWSPLVMFDPPIYPRVGHPLEATESEHMRDMAALARRRPERYPDTASFAAQLSSRAGFRRWVPGAHDLFARATLRPDPGGDGFVLRCPRELEARIFEFNVDPTVWPHLAGVAVPMFLIGADTGLDGQLAPAFLTEGLARDQGIPYAMIPDTTHFLQIERPHEVLREMEAFLARQGVHAAA
ncbi:MAG: alpha/beta hydrolase [Candidatus Odyssella sp.]|nr:alpha/beta hydrolase [Candidatus Odyssella sp.]